MTQLEKDRKSASLESDVIRSGGIVREATMTVARGNGNFSPRTVRRVPPALGVKANCDWSFAASRWVTLLADTIIPQRHRGLCVSKSRFHPVLSG